MAISMFMLNKGYKINSWIEPIKIKEKKNKISAFNENLKTILNESIPYETTKFDMRVMDDSQDYFWYQSSISNNVKYQTDLLKKSLMNDKPEVVFKKRPLQIKPALKRLEYSRIQICFINFKN